MSVPLEGADGSILFYVNGRKVCVDQPDPEMTLLYFLRNKLRLSGTKLGCADGGCGACTVMVSRYNRESDKIDHFSVNACLARLCAMDGLAVTTVEGIGSTKTVLHPCQERIAHAHGSQCGLCTPGIVMSMYTLLRNNPTPSEEEIESTFEGNLCRCTGYRPILEGYKTFTKGYCCSSVWKDGKCCMEREKKLTTVEDSSVVFDASKFIPLDPTQELIFPAALKLQVTPKPLAIQGPRVQWYRPTSLQQLLELREQFPQTKERGKPWYRLVVGNTEIGVDVKFRGIHYPVLITPSHIPEMNKVEVKGEGVEVGAAVSLNQLANTLREFVRTMPEHKTRTFATLLKMSQWFAGQQIRNVASVGGNIINASPISDLNPILMASGTKLNFAAKDSRRTVVMDSSFFTGYKQTVMKPNEVLLSILIPFTRENEYVYSFKQTRRKSDDIAIVNAGMRVVLHPSEPYWTVDECTLSYGGMSYITTMARKTQQALIGKPWNEATLQEACGLLLEDLPLSPDAPGGMVEFRQSLVTSFLFKFYLTVLSRISAEPLPLELQSSTEPFHREPARSTQGFQQVSDDQLSHDAVGKPMMHQSALKQEDFFSHSSSTCSMKLQTVFVQ